MKLALVFLLCAAPLSAQRLRMDPDWRLWATDSRQHFAAGAGLGIAAHVVLPKARTWQRLAVAGAIQAAWELGQADATERHGPGYGYSPKDWLLGMLGACVTEGVWSLARKHE